MNGDTVTQHTASSTPIARLHARQRRGFTLIELIVVMAIIGMLVALAMPKYLNSVERGRENVLRHDLRTLREAIDRHYADRGHYPQTLEDLALRRYLRAVPVDPLTDSATTWRLLPPPPGRGNGVYDLRSGAPGAGLDGVNYEDW